LLGLREIDSLTLTFVRAFGLIRAGALRSLATCVTELDPDILAVSEIDAGDALAIATRSDRQWAYRGGQALLWNRRFAARKVHDLYLPVLPLQPFERRGLLRVDGLCDGSELTLFATRFSPDRTRIRDLRFARSAIRACSAKVVLFVAAPPPVRARIGFADLGLQSRCGDDIADLMVAARGFVLNSCNVGAERDGIGAPVVARLTA
jgi:hypothetical protein